MEETSTFKHEWQEVDEELGTYECFARVVELSGYFFDPQGAVERARKYCDACFKLGGDWVDNNCMIQELEFFHLKRQHRSLMGKKWQLMQKARMITDAGQAEPAAEQPPEKRPRTAQTAKPGSETTGAMPGTPIAKAQATPKGKGKGKEKNTKGAATEPGTQQKSERKNALDKMCVTANKVKTKHNGAITRSNGVLENIKTDTAWSRCQIPKFQGKLQEARESLRSSLDAFGQSLVLNELAELRKTTDPATLEVELKNFNGLETKVDNLQKICAWIVGIKPSCDAVDLMES